MADASTKVAIGASIAHIASGASLAAGAFSASTEVDVALSGSSNLSNYPRCDVVLTYRPGSTTSTTAMNIFLYRRDINAGGNSALDENPPTTNYSNKFMGAYTVPVSLSTGTYYMTLNDIPLPGANQDCEFYIQNNLTNTIPANGWDLTVIPKTDYGATS